MSPASTVVSRVYTKEELCVMERVPDPCGLIIFGASGDLTHRKLLPSIFKLAQEKVLPANFYILGVSRTAYTDAAFQDMVREDLSGTGSPEEREAFVSRCHYLTGDYAASQTYETLDTRVNTYEKTHGIPGRRIFYLATPPSLYETICQQLAAAGLARSREKGGWVRVVVEKPFGRALPSAQALAHCLHRMLQEDQIYRIDHYLGKETVQNILMFRFANAIYEPLWNRKYIDHIAITAAETVGVEHRAGYYEQTGVLRDMFQNHLFQLLSLVAMEPPATLEANPFRDEKSKVLAALRPLGIADYPQRAVRGQYAAGRIDGKEVVAYRQEPGVDAHSWRETFAALRLEIDNWRWQGVPFYLRSGKRLAQRITEIAVQFKHVPTSIFKPLMAEQLSANRLLFRIQPDEGISLRFEAKHPGSKLCMSSVTMQFNYAESFGTPPPEAYTRLFLDVMLGDQMLFSRQDWLLHSWGFLTPLLNFWEEQKNQGLSLYPAGSWGPPEADALPAREGRQWN